MTSKDALHIYRRMMMAKRIITTVSLVGLLTLGQTGAMENPNNPNPDTVARIAELIQTFGFQENKPETKEIILDALQGVMATDEEIREAFQEVNSQEKEIAQEKQIPQEQKTSGKLGRELTATEKENAYKMLLMKQAMQGTEVPQDVQGVIGQTLHDLSANPVLDGELKFEGKPYKIRKLLKEDGSIDLSNPVFEDASTHLLITTDPEQFFNTVKGSKRIVIMIAPKFVIQQYIKKPCCTSFEGMMANWKEDHAPIGIFYRMEGSYERVYNYNTLIDVLTLSKNNLFSIGDQCFSHPRASGWHTSLRLQLHQSARWLFLKKFHVHF